MDANGLGVAGRGWPQLCIPDWAWPQQSKRAPDVPAMWRTRHHAIGLAPGCRAPDARTSEGPFIAASMIERGSLTRAIKCRHPTQHD